MKRALFGITLSILILAACAPQAQATQSPSLIGGEPTHINTDLTPAQRLAISKLAENLGLTPDKIKLVSTEAVDWPDSCLGIQKEGFACAQMVTPGFKIILEANGHQVEYRTNQDGSVIVPATVAVTWSRVGGIAGFCDNLTVYLSGEVQGTSCKKDQLFEKPVSELLTAQEIATMNDWISKYGVVDIDSSDPKGVADAMTIKLKLIGTGKEQMDAALQQVLLQFMQSLNQKLMASYP